MNIHQTHRANFVTLLTTPQKFAHRSSCHIVVIKSKNSFAVMQLGKAATEDQIGN